MKVYDFSYGRRSDKHMFAVSSSFMESAIAVNSRFSENSLELRSKSDLTGNGKTGGLDCRLYTYCSETEFKHLLNHIRPPALTSVDVDAICFCFPPISYRVSPRSKMTVWPWRIATHDEWLQRAISALIFKEEEKYELL